MTDLSDLVEEISELHLSAPPLADIIRRATLGRRRRMQRRWSAVAIALALVVPVTILLLGSTANKHPAPRGASPYAGTASAAFVARDGLLYVADQGNNTLSELDPTGTPPFDHVGTVALPFTPGVVAISPDATTAYVSPLVPEFAGGSNSLYVIKLADGHVVRRIVDHLQPLGRVTIAPDGATAYAWGDDVVPVNLNSGTIRPPIARSTGEYTDFEIAPDGMTALASSDGPSPGFQLINLTKGTISRTVSTADLRVDDLSGFWSPETIAYAPDGATAYVVAEKVTPEGSETGLLKVSARTGSIYSAVVLGNGEAGNVVVAPDGEKAFVFVQIDVPHVESGAFEIVPVDLANMKPSAKIKVGDAQGLGLLGIPGQMTLYAIDTRWRVTGIDETTDAIVGSSVIPVRSLLAPTLQPIAFVG